MKSITIQQMENIEGGSAFSDFCKGFGAGQIGVAAAVRLGIIAMPAIGQTVGTIILAIDIACLWS